MSSFGVYLKGDWRKLNALARYLEALPKEIEDLIRAEAENVALEMREGLRDGHYPLSPPHSPATVKRWGDHNLLYLEGDFAESIEVIEHSLRSGHTNFIIGTQKYAQLAEWLEYGTSRMPGRHFFEIASDLMVGTFINKINKVVGRF